MLNPGSQATVLQPKDGSCPIMVLIGSAKRGSTFGATFVGRSYTVRRGTPNQEQSLVRGTLMPSARRP